MNFPADYVTNNDCVLLPVPPFRHRYRATTSPRRYQKNKSYCEDLTEGKFSYPIIHCILSNPRDNRLLNILKQRTSDLDMKQYAVRLMHETGSLGYTMNVINTLKTECSALLSKHGGKGAAIIGALMEKLHAGLEDMGLAEMSPKSSGRRVGQPATGEAANPSRLTLAHSA